MEKTTSAEKVLGILNQNSSNKKDKPHVTWDEDQLAEHEKTRGNKMKIDEPKTPYVTEEEFQRLCREDPDYVKEFGDELRANMKASQDANSDAADEDQFSDKDSCERGGING